eukprot:TRINITY_DN6221_c0_g4_i1.p1 TRINITY_DN6221_c0_g4~~TRINITY_DN6221_c0_g4_i1.p1  ORF type:complete len:476 (-),score=204.51 TRINITY_DN6221_c0_g4_i1:351-1778(-)
MSSLWTAFGWGLASAASFPLGALVSLFIFDVPKRWNAAMLAFGVGALLFALAYDLFCLPLCELHEVLAKHSDLNKAKEKIPLVLILIGAILGGLIFEFSNYALENRGAFMRSFALRKEYLRRLLKEVQKNNKWMGEDNEMEIQIYKQKIRALSRRGEGKRGRRQKAQSWAPSLHSSSPHFSSPSPSHFTSPSPSPSPSTSPSYLPPTSPSATSPRDNQPTTKWPLGISFSRKTQQASIPIGGARGRERDSPISASYSFFPSRRQPENDLALPLLNEFGQEIETEREKEREAEREKERETEREKEREVKGEGEGEGKVGGERLERTEKKTVSLSPLEKEKQEERQKEREEGREKKVGGEGEGEREGEKKEERSLEIAQALGAHIEEKYVGVMIWMGLLIDSIPESIVIGLLTLKSEGITVEVLSFVFGVILSNFPEALSSSVIMLEEGFSKFQIMVMWLSIMLMTGFGALIGAAVF